MANLGGNRLTLKANQYKENRYPCPSTIPCQGAVYRLVIDDWSGAAEFVTTRACTLRD